MGPFSRSLSTVAYHRILPQYDPLCPDEVTASQFERQVVALGRVFTVLHLSDAVRMLRAGNLPSRAACITFDDGYANNAIIAMPILKRLGMPATFFISTGFLNGGRMWNDTIIEVVRCTPRKRLDVRDFGLQSLEVDSVESRRYAIDQLIGALKYRPAPERQQATEELAAKADVNLDYRPMLTTEQVKMLAHAGMEIGGHTVSHPILATLDANTAYREITEGKAELERLIGKPVTSFAYPNGKPGVDYLKTHVQMVEDAGFSAAVTTAWGVGRQESDVYQLPRFTPWDKTPKRFAFRLLLNTFRTAPERV